MSVTMEVGLDGLIKSLANNTKDPVLNKALDQAIARKANSGTDLITLFGEEYNKLAPDGKLAPFFVNRSNTKIKFDASNTAVLSYLRDQSSNAFNNTLRILRTRIDRFGVAGPSINPDPAKGIITIELAGVNDPERVRHYLQSTANLQFFEVYNLGEIGDQLLTADKAMADYLKGTSSNDTTKAVNKVIDTTNRQATANAIDTTKTHTLSSLSDTSAKAAGLDSARIREREAPIRSLFAAFGQGQQGQNGGVQYPSYIGYIQIKDTGALGDYLRKDIVRNKFPSNLLFMYGKRETSDPNMKNMLPAVRCKNHQSWYCGTGRRKCK